MTYAEAIQSLYDLQLFGAKLGLETARRLAELAGSPHEQLRFIHVAGTNGKGSTCAMLESACRAAGLRTGLYTSPHLVSFRERIQVDRQPVSEADTIRLVQEIRGLSAQFPRETPPTCFEAVTVMALRHFAEQRCDVVIWEAGLGGRLDATNIVTPLASVITNIALEHQQWLGDTLAEIAAEKAGIIKPGVPVVTAAESPEAVEAIAEAARRAGSPLTVVTVADTTRPPLDTIQLPLLGEHQRLNAALAVATLRAVADKLPVGEDALRRGLESVSWLGRLQLVKRPDGRLLLLDGAHNPAGIEALRAALARHFPGTKPAFILGMLADKDWPAMCRTLAPLAGRILLAPVQGARGCAPEALAAACREAAPAVPVETFDSLAAALAATETEPFTVVTGSLHFLGEAMERLGQLTAGLQDERGLNEWTSTTARPQ